MSPHHYTIILVIMLAYALYERAGLSTLTWIELDTSFIFMYQTS